jgi:hypothetical protein
MIPHPRPSHTGDILCNLLLQNAVDIESGDARDPIDAVLSQAVPWVDAMGGGAGATVIGVVERRDFGCGVAE